MKNSDMRRGRAKTIGFFSGGISRQILKT